LGTECPLTSAKEAKDIIPSIMIDAWEELIPKDVIGIKCDVEISRRWNGEAINV
jgi:hypothetical protein